MATKTDRVGEEKINSQGCKMRIIRYKSKEDIDVEFENGYISKNKKYSNFIKGAIKNPYFASVCGIGYLGVGEYKTRINNLRTEENKIWCSMLFRCYDLNCLKNRPSYDNVEVCNEWHNFQTFSRWYYDNKWTNDLVLTPDKDILGHGKNKIYSPDTVLLVDSFINQLFVKSDKIRGKFYLGVHYDKKAKGFIAQISIKNNVQYLGRFTTPEEAFLAYKNFKEAYIKSVADEYKSKYPNFPQRLYDAMYNYKVEIND